MRWPARFAAAALTLGVPAAAGAQAVDTARAVSELEAFGASCEALGERLWGASLCGPVVLVHAATRSAIANRQDPAGTFAAAHGAWVGRVPDTLPLANTAMTWDGEAWAMLLLPLPDDAFDRARLLAHEAFHRVQPSLGLWGRDAASAHLDEAGGRILLRLELRALAEALEAGDDATAALRAALAFRAERYRRYPGADTLEAQLERQEGLAEYTGVRYALEQSGAGVERVAAMLRAYEGRPTYTRSFAYATGPALGLLLDRYAVDWRQRVRDHGLADLLAEAAALDAADIAAAEHTGQLERLGMRFGYAALVVEEDTRAAQHAAALRDVRDRLVEGAVVTLRHAQLSGTFNPNELLVVPGEGTYHPRGTFAAEWGRVTVETGGVLVAPDWTWLRLPGFEAEAARAGGVIHGAGWTLELADGWELRREAGGGWYAERRDEPHHAGVHRPRSPL